MCVESVQAGAEVVGSTWGLYLVAKMRKIDFKIPTLPPKSTLILTKLKTITAVNIEVMVTRLPLAAVGVEYEAIGTQLILGNAINTFIVFVALLCVFKSPVSFRANKVLG